MGVKNFIMAPALDLIIAQRLVRTLCENCSEQKPLTEIERQRLQEVLASIQKKGVEVPPMPEFLGHSKGCEACGLLGYQGQIAITEVLRFNQEIVLTSFSQIMTDT